MAPDAPVWQPTILARPERNMTISQLWVNYQYAGLHPGLRTSPQCDVPASTTPLVFRTWVDSLIRVASQRSNQFGQRVRPAGEKLAGWLDCHTSYHTDNLQAKFPRILIQYGQNDLEARGQWPPFPIPAESIPGCMFGANFVILAQICNELSCRQAKIILKVKVNDLHCQYQLKVFYDVCLVQICDTSLNLRWIIMWTK